MKKKFKEILEKEDVKKKSRAKGFYFGSSKVLHSNISEEEKLHFELVRQFKKR